MPGPLLCGFSLFTLVLLACQFVSGVMQSLVFSILIVINVM